MRDFIIELIEEWKPYRTFGFNYELPFKIDAFDSTTIQCHTVNPEIRHCLKTETVFNKGKAVGVVHNFTGSSVSFDTILVK